jgi:hypothetical protein
MKQVDRQRLGGVASLSGNDFESHFAVWRVLLALERARLGKPGRLAQQLRACHVDDWAERDADGSRYFQLRRRRQQNWGQVREAFISQLAAGKSASVTWVVASTALAARLFRRELGLDDVGARVPHHELDRAIGYGRRISETLLDFAGPVLDEPGQDFEAAVRFATRVWNVVVAQERGWSTAEIERLRAELHTRAFPAKLLKTYDTLVARKHARFAGDLRMVGSWNVERSRGRVGVQMQALLSPELIAQATAAGLKP